MRIFLCSLDIRKSFGCCLSFHFPCSLFLLFVSNPAFDKRVSIGKYSYDIFISFCRFSSLKIVSCGFFLILLIMISINCFVCRLYFMLSSNFFRTGSNLCSFSEVYTPAKKAPNSKMASMDMYANFLTFELQNIFRCKFDQALSCAVMAYLQKSLSPRRQLLFLIKNSMDIPVFQINISQMCAIAWAVV